MGDDTIKKNISKNIAKYRESAGLSQKELANKLGVVPEFLIGKLERTVLQ